MSQERMARQVLLATPHSQESGLEAVRGLGGVTKSPTLLGPVLMWNQQNYVGLLLNVRYFESSWSCCCSRDRSQRKRGNENEWIKFALTFTHITCLELKTTTLFFKEINSEKSRDDKNNVGKASKVKNKIGFCFLLKCVASVIELKQKLIGERSCFTSTQNKEKQSQHAKAEKGSMQEWTVWHFPTKCAAVKFAEPWKSNHFYESQLRWLGQVFRMSQEKCRGKYCWLHLRENGPEVAQGPGRGTKSPNFLGPVLVWMQL